MCLEDDIRSVEMVEEQVEIVTGQGVGIFGGGGLHLLTATQRDFIIHLAVLGLDEFVLDPI